MCCPPETALTKGAAQSLKQGGTGRRRLWVWLRGLERAGRNPGHIDSPSGPACSTWPRRGPPCGRGSTGPAPPPPSGPRSPAGSPPGSSCKDRRTPGPSRCPSRPAPASVRARPDCASNNLPSPGRIGGQEARAVWGDRQACGTDGEREWGYPQASSQEKLWLRRPSLGTHSSGLRRGESERSPHLGIVSRREDVGMALRCFSSHKNAHVG